MEAWALPPPAMSSRVQVRTSCTDMALIADPSNTLKCPTPTGKIPLRRAC